MNIEFGKLDGKKVHLLVGEAGEFWLTGCGIFIPNANRMRAVAEEKDFCKVCLKKLRRSCKV